MTVRIRWLKYSQILLVGGTLTAGSAFAAGSDAPPDVEVNWGLLDRLGQQSTLPQLLLRDEGKDTTAIPPGPSPSVQFRPYRPGDGVEEKASSPPKALPVPSRGSAPASDGPVYRTYQPKAKPDVPAPKPRAVTPPIAQSPPVPVEKVEKPTEKAVPLPVIPQVDAPKPALPSVEPPQAVVPAPVMVPKAEPPKVESPSVVMPKVDVPTIEPPKVEIPPAPPLEATPERPVQPTLPPPPPPPPVAPDLSFPKNPVPEAPAAGESVATPVATPAPTMPSVPSSSPSSSAARVEGNTLIVAFAADDATIAEAAKPLLNELADRLAKDEGLSIQFLAYAGGDEAQASKARRLSLTRALTVRQFFLDRGVRSTRMEVRAMGNRGATNRSPVDRVEVVVVSR